MGDAGGNAPGAIAFRPAVACSLASELNRLVQTQVGMRLAHESGSMLRDPRAALKKKRFSSLRDVEHQDVLDHLWETFRPPGHLRDRAHCAVHLGSFRISRALA